MQGQLLYVLGPEEASGGKKNIGMGRRCEATSVDSGISWREGGATWKGQAERG